jgi:gliding motility-associated-like protein
MDLTPVEACFDGIATAIFNGGEILDGNDKLSFALHDGNIPSGIIAWSDTPSFHFTGTMQIDSVYFISAVVGDEDINGLPFLNDPCLFVSPGTPVRFHSPPIANAGEDKILGCVPDKILLSADGSSSGPNIDYQWSTSGGSILGATNSNQINAAAGGLYILSVIDLISGCESSDTAEVTENELIIDQLQLESVSPLCTGDCNGMIRILHATGNLLFDFGSGNFVPDTMFTAACSGPVNIAVMDTFGCVVDTMITIDAPQPVEVNIGPDTNIIYGDSILLYANSISDLIQFNWFAASSCTNCNQIIVSPTVTTTYRIEVTDVNQCTATDERVVSLLFGGDVFVPSIFSPNGDQVNDIFFIRGGPDLESIQDFEIFDRWGNKIFEKNNIDPGDISQGWNGTYKNAPVLPGVYVYKVDAKFITGKPLHLTGDVTVVR